MTRRMIPLPPEHTRVLVEQALAFGRSEEWIRAHIPVTGAEIGRVRLHLDDVNRQEDDPARVVCRNGLHDATPENTYTWPNGRITCRPCRQEGNARRRDKRREEKAAKEKAA